MPKISIIIINYNTPLMTKKALDRLFENEPDLDLEIILVDNGSAAKVPPEDRADVRVRYIDSPVNGGFAAGVNLGWRQARGEYLLLLNSDVLVESGSASRMIDYLDHNPRVGIAGPLMAYPSGGTQASWGFFPTLGREIMRFAMLSKFLPGGTVVFRHRWTEGWFRAPKPAHWVSGGCMFIRSVVVRQIGEFDEKYFFGVEDFDFCRRARAAGWTVMFNPEVKVVHFHGMSSGGRRSTWSLRQEGQGMDRFIKKHYPARQSMYLRLSVKLMYFSKALALDAFFKLRPQKKIC